ncbi:MAG TPA: septum formation initiator family protein [Candidatus Acidoferrum sp.]|jgi:cell division protein FtsB
MAILSRPIVPDGSLSQVFPLRKEGKSRNPAMVAAWTLAAQKIVPGLTLALQNPKSGLEFELPMSIDRQEKLGNAVRHYVPHLLAVFVAVLFLHDVFGTHGFVAMHRKQQEIQKVKTDLERLNNENSGLEQDVKNLKTDPHTIEKIAREELGQARPGEVIIKLPAPPPSDSQPTKP